MDSSGRHILERRTEETEQANSLVRPSSSTTPLPSGFWSRPHTHSWLWIIPVAGLGAGLLYWSYGLLPKTGVVGTQGSASIQIEPTLRVNWIGGDLNVTWKRDALTQQTGERGILRIIDGGIQKELPLTAEQLQSGQRLYTPLSNDFRVELDIVRLGLPPTTEAIQVLSPGKYAYVPPRNSPAVPGATQTSPTSPVRQPVAPPTTSPAGTPAPQSQKDVVPSASIPASRPAEPQPPAESPVRTSAVPEAAPPAKPTIQTAANTAVPEPVPVAPPPAVRPEPTQQAQASSPVSAPEAVIPSPLVGRPTPSAQLAITPPTAVTPSRGNATLSFVPAQPIRTVQASIPNQIRAGLNGPAQVDVRVSIDATGRVINSSIKGQTGTVMPVLRTAAESAARQWRFQPARLRGLAVSSEIVLRFRFTPGEQP